MAPWDRQCDDVMAVGDPVGTGIVSSLARPGGNITGLSATAPDLEGKRLGLLREVVPNLSQVAFFLNPANALMKFLCARRGPPRTRYT